MALYQSNFFDSNDVVSHRAGHSDRLKIIRSNINGNSLLDLGCNRGFFSFGLMDEYSSVLGIDQDRDLIYECNNLKEKYNIEFIDFICNDIVSYIDETELIWDTVLYMSVHHHAIEQIGFEEAGIFFNKISCKCNQMIFDMGQKNEKGCQDHLWWKMLPAVDDQRAWLKEYILKNTLFQTVEIIGSSEIHNVKRFLWKLIK